jgi:hypothetical protein
VPILTRLMSSTDPDTRSGAALALENMQPHNAHPQQHYMH